MYKDYFGFSEEPFSIAPDPQFLYMSERHREALAHLIYGMKADSGFVLLTGEVGTGKTTVCRCLLGQIPESSDIAFILNPKVSVLELLETICDELKIPSPEEKGSVKVFVDLINHFLLNAHAKGRQTILIIDEAQNLSSDVLEQIRLLTNLETDKHKLLQVIMLGQPELNHILERPEMRQLAQRVTARYHLEPLSRDELDGYLQHRLAVAGVDRPLFPRASIQKVYSLTGGVPRLINLLCDRALLGAYVKAQASVSPELLKEAAVEIFGNKACNRERNGFVQWMIALLLGLILVTSVFFVVTFVRVTSIEPVTAPVPAEDSRLIVKAQEKPVEPLVWSGAGTVEESGMRAYRSLFKLWGIDSVNLDGGARSAAELHGLELVTKRASLGRLRQLNRPAVLKINDPDGTGFYATLAHLDDDNATLIIDQSVRRVPVTQLLTQWFGDYGLLWQPPEGYRGALKPGQESSLVPWLEKVMADISGQTTGSSGQETLDGALLDQIRSFQKKAGLADDGVVGPYTLVLLNAQVGSGQPTLDQ